MKSRSDQEHPTSDAERAANLGARVGEPPANGTGTTLPGRGVEGSPDVTNIRGVSNFSGGAGDGTNMPRTSGSEVDLKEFDAKASERRLGGERFSDEEGGRSVMD